MGKPKKNAKIASDIRLQPKVLGTRIRYISLGGSKAVCVACGRSKKIGMISRFKEKYYCNETCIRKQEK